MPQPPQFAPSVWKLTQRLPPQALGLFPEHWHVPATQEPAEQLFADVLHAWPRPTLFSTQAPFWQTCPPPQFPGWPFATVPQTPELALQVWQGPPQLQHCVFGMHTLLAQERGALAGQTQVLLVELHEVRPPVVVQPLLSQHAPAWSVMQRPSRQSTVPDGHPQLPLMHS